MTRYPHHIGAERLKRLETNVHYDQCPEATKDSLDRQELCNDDCVWELVNELVGRVGHLQRLLSETAT